MTKKNKKIDMESEESVQEMIRTWDAINCAKCGKPISMLDSKTINLGDNFYCKDCYRRYED